MTAGGAGAASRGARWRGALRSLLTPGWLTVHLVVAALAVTMVLLGRWQLTVSNRKHFDLQNFGYSLQWWAFTAFGLFLWVRIMRDHLRARRGAGPAAGTDLVRQVGPPTTGPAVLVRPATEPGGAPVTYRGYVMPTSATQPVRSHGDTYHDAYNDYLWQLSLADAADAGGVSPRAEQPWHDDGDPR